MVWICILDASSAICKRVDGGLQIKRQNEELGGQMPMADQQRSDHKSIENSASLLHTHRLIDNNNFESN